MRGRSVITYKGGLEEEMITDREMASSVGRGEERGISPAAAVGDGGGGLDLPYPDLAPG